jgi:hypothetical protein
MRPKLGVDLHQIWRSHASTREPVGGELRNPYRLLPFFVAGYEGLEPRIEFAHVSPR